jgi:hypothetical protein
MKQCEGDGDCSAQPDAECLGCILGISEIEMKALQRSLEENTEGLHKAGLGGGTIECIIDAMTV